MFATLHAGIGVKQTHSYARSLEKKLRGPYSNRHQTHLAFCRDYSAVHGAIFYLKRKGFRFPTRLSAICKAVDRVTFFTSGKDSASPLGKRQRKDGSVDRYSG